MTENTDETPTPKATKLVKGEPMETATASLEPETAISKLKSRTEWQAFLALVLTIVGNAFAKTFLGVEALDQATILELLGAFGTYGVTVAARKFGAKR